MRYRFLCFPGGKRKAVTFSYDDGCRHDIRFADILLKYGLKATFNINSGLLGKDEKDWHLTAEEIQEHLISKNFEIANHGAYHKANGLLRPVEGIQEVLNCRLSLEKTFGGIIRGMAYPDSGINHFENRASYENIRRYLNDLDIAYVRTTVNDHSFRLPTDWYAWNPTCHHSDKDTMDLIEQFLLIDSNPSYLANRYPRLFYIWGHSYEFENNHNWAFLEEICEKLSGHDDIWYATNMEIYNYVNAYNSLVFNADSTVVFNPTLFKIWFSFDENFYEVEPGETISLVE